jgi:hypothetical protein
MHERHVKKMIDKAKQSAEEAPLFEQPEAPSG